MNNAEARPTIYKQYEDGYTVRAMTVQDAKQVEEWFVGIGVVSKHEVDTAMASYPPGSLGFYIGEYEDKVVASSICIPWGENIYYLSLFYVAKEYRGKGFGARIREAVAFTHAGKDICVVAESLEGKVSESNKKFGFVPAEIIKAGRFHGTAKECYGVPCSKKIVEGCKVDFDKLMGYDNQCFVSQNFPARRKFLKQLITFGATYVAQDDGGKVIGFGCRRPCFQENNHYVGPVYADSSDIAEAIIQKLAVDVAGDNLTMDIWMNNEASAKIVEKLGFKNVFNLQRMYANGDPKDFKNQVFAMTSLFVCGF